MFRVVGEEIQGFSIEARWPEGSIERLAGLFLSAEAAEQWLKDGGGDRC
jgi:hypothetical protein